MNEQKIIIGLVGQIAAGKGAVAKYIEEKYGARTFRFSTILRDMLDRGYIEKSRDNLQKLSTFLRQNFGEDVFAKVIAEDVKNCDKSVVVVDGIRRLADIKYLSEIPGFTLVKITASPEKRYERLVKRNENSDDIKKTFDQFIEDQKKEADAEIPLVMENASKEINNGQSFTELYSQIDQLIDDLKK